MKTGQYERVSAEAVTVPPWNPRTDLDARGMRFLQNSFAVFGNAELMVLNKTTGNLIAGAKRFEYLKSQGQTEIDVWVVELTAMEEQVASLTLNNHVGQFDNDGVRSVLKSAGEASNAATLLGALAVSDADIQKILHPDSSGAPNQGVALDANQMPLVFTEAGAYAAFQSKLTAIWQAHGLPGEAVGNTILRLLSEEAKS